MLPSLGYRLARADATDSPPGCPLNASALDRTSGEAGLPVALETEEEHDHRQHTEQSTHHQSATISEGSQRDHAVQTQGHRLQPFIHFSSLRQQEVVPSGHEQEQEDRDHCRSQNPQHNGEEDASFACTIDTRRLKQLVRH